jgi:hypothetical protein
MMLCATPRLLAYFATSIINGVSAPRTACAREPAGGLIFRLGFFAIGTILVMSSSSFA